MQHPTNQPEPDFTCNLPINTGPQTFVLRAAIATSTAGSRTAPRRPRRPPRDGHIQPLQYARRRQRHRARRDPHPAVDAPVAVLGGLGQTGPSQFCRLFGTTPPPLTASSSPRCTRTTAASCRSWSERRSSRPLRRVPPPGGRRKHLKSSGPADIRNNASTGGPVGNGMGSRSAQVDRGRVAAPPVWTAVAAGDGDVGRLAPVADAGGRTPASTAPAGSVIPLPGSPHGTRPISTTSGARPRGCASSRRTRRSPRPRPRTPPRARAHFVGDPFRAPHRWAGKRGRYEQITYTDRDGNTWPAALFGPRDADGGPYPGVLLVCHACFPLPANDRERRRCGTGPPSRSPKPATS